VITTVTIRPRQVGEQQLPDGVRIDSNDLVTF